ncbi:MULTISPECIES: hypothetical protein [Elizabethkingia]|uniref:hypothetical protein n=1 Tax=Elizabethkingia TaxID=308865 RepID=UPI0020A1597C|nr:hypothetical protein [Elizabethkingia sp. S0634]MCP1253365.1 hypothetical protein [Elizabethkingia sp. S0634]
MANNEKAKDEKEYTSPMIEVLIIEMENCISAASATVIPTNTSGQVQEDWTDGTNETNNISW